MEISQKTRWNYIDILKGIGIILVVLGHTDRISDDLLKWIFSFHMVLFFVVAGYLIGKQYRGEKVKEIALKRTAQKILLPYFWFSLFAIVWDAAGMIIGRPGYSIDSMIEKGRDFITGYGISVLWFLPAYFVAVVLYRALRSRLNYGLCLMSCILLSATYLLIEWVPAYALNAERVLEPGVVALLFSFAIWRGVFCALFVALGEGICLFTEHIWKRKVLCVITALGALGIGSLAGMYNEMASLRYLQIGNAFLFVVSGVGITTGLLMICKWYGECSPLEFAGRNSLLILVTHLDFRIMNAALKCSDKVFEITDHNFARNLTLAVVLIVLEIIVIFILNRFFYFLFGKKETVKDKIFAPSREEE